MKRAAALRLFLAFALAIALLNGCEKPNPKPGKPIAPRSPAGIVRLI